MVGDVDDTLRQIFKEVFAVNVKDDDSIDTIGLWDSMGHMELVAAIEKHCQSQIGPDEIIKLTSVKAIKNFLERNAK